MKCKPTVYFSSRHSLSPALERMMKALSRHVNLVGNGEDPEIAYATIDDSDVFLFNLYFDICQNLFLMYELGVALVLRKPVIVIREAELKFSEIFIPKHFSEIKLLIPPNRSGPFQTCDVLGKTYNLPLSLEDILVYSYENSIAFSSQLQTKCIALLLDKIFSFSRGPGNQFTSSKVKITLQNRKSNYGGHGYSKIALLPLNRCGDGKLKTNSVVNEGKLDQLSSNEKKISVNQAPKINISFLIDHDCKDERSADEKHLENRIEPVKPVTLQSKSTPEVDSLKMHSVSMFEPVNPVELHPGNQFEPIIYEFATASRDDVEEGLDMSDSSSTSDVTLLNDKTFIASANTSPLPSPISPRGIYYPTALPVYPMEMSFPPFQIEKLNFDKHALQIAKADRLPSIVRRRIMRKEL